MAMGKIEDFPTLPTTPVGWIRGLVAQVLRDMASLDRTISAPAYSWLVSSHAYATVSYLAPDYLPDFLLIRDHWQRWAELGRPRAWLDVEPPSYQKYQHRDARPVGSVVPCEHCGKPFALRHPNQKFCTILCGHRAWRARERDTNATAGAS